VCVCVRARGRDLRVCMYSPSENARAHEIFVCEKEQKTFKVNCLLQ
jgi:hypothetical protein